MNQTPPPGQPYGEQPEPPPTGQPVSGQPPYGQPDHAQPSYAQPPYGQPTNAYGAPGVGGFAPPDHQQAVLVLVLGILGLVVCQLVAPFAWVMGNRVVGEIDAAGGQLGGRSMANAGRICGMIGTILLGLSLLVLVGLVVLAVASTTTA